MNKWSIPENLVNKKFISPKELKEILGISLPTVYRLIESRKLPAFKIGNSLRFLREDIVAYLETHRIDQIM
jgi:excisionase family DNA binding protein